jgi:hypothetical protein
MAAEEVQEREQKQLFLYVDSVIRIILKMFIYRPMQKSSKLGMT